MLLYNTFIVHRRVIVPYRLYRENIRISWVLHPGTQKQEGKCISVDIIRFIFQNGAIHGKSVIVMCVHKFAYIT